jgi:Ca2+-binding RTX toxin-like protein
VLVGGLGNDNLTGGADSDFFVLNATLGTTTNMDTITDFAHLIDHIQLENSIFTQLSVVGTLNVANFRSSLDGAAADANDYILYNSLNGRLYYDSNGNGAGGATQIALIGVFGHATLTAADFTVI